MKTLPLHETHIRAGAAIEEHTGWLRPAHFGDPAREYQAAIHHAAVFDMTGRSIVELAGPDARGFLHNLCTNEVRSLPVGAGCEAFLLTAKGRVVAHTLVGHFQQGDTSVLRLDAVPEQATTILAHLDHYLISEQVELADRSAECGFFHIAGPQSGAILNAALGANVEDLAPLHHRPLPLGTVRRDPALGLDGFDLIVPVERSADLWRVLAEAGAVPAGTKARDTLRIEAGIPEFGADFDAERLGMEVGRTAQAISFAKGCYLGQETVVMARDLGHVNRALMGVEATDDAPLTPKSPLLRGADPVGEMGSTALSPHIGRAIGLAYLRRGSQEAGTELTAGPVESARRVIVAALPFRR